VQVPVGKGATREAFGLLASLPHSMAHACTFTFGRTTADLCPALVRCFTQLGGIPTAVVVDNDASIVGSRRGGMVTLVDDVAAQLGQLAIKAIPLRPRFAEGKGQGERTIGTWRRSFLPSRRFADLDDLQGQHDTWARTAAFERHPRRPCGHAG